MAKTIKNHLGDVKFTDFYIKRIGQGSMWLYIYGKTKEGEILVKRHYRDSIITIPKNNFDLHFKTPDNIYELSLPELILGTSFQKTIDPKIKISEDKIDVIREAIMEEIQDTKKKLYWSREDFNQNIKEFFYQNEEMIYKILGELQLLVKEVERIEKGVFNKKGYGGVSIYNNLENKERLPKPGKEIKEKALETINLINKTIKEVLKERLKNKEVFEKKLKNKTRDIKINIEEKGGDFAELVIVELFEKYGSRLKAVLINKEGKKETRTIAKPASTYGGKVLLISKGKSRYGNYLDFDDYKEIIIKGLEDEVKFEDPKMQKDFNEYIKAKERFKKILKFKKLDFHPNTKGWTFREKVEALPSDFETYFLDGAKSLYEYGVTSGTAIDGQIIGETRLKSLFGDNITEQLKEALDNMQPFYTSSTSDYDYSISVEPRPTKENPEYVMLFFNKEYKGTGNGYYYLGANEKEFIGIDID